MRIFTAHLKPTRAPILTPEGWSWGACCLGPVWLIGVRAWIPALLEIAGIVLVLSLAPPPFRPALMISLCVLNGLLGRDMARWSLERRGYALRHVVVASDHDAALLRLLTDHPDLVQLAESSL